MIFRASFVLRAAALVSLLQICLLPTAHADSAWDQPAATLARQIASLTGPGPAKLILRNNSTLALGELPVIRQLLERDLRSFGVIAGANDSATIIRVTLSQNFQGGLWIAEVQEGTESRITMLPVALAGSVSTGAGPTLTLRRTLLLTDPNPVLDAAVFSAPGQQRLVVLEPDRIVFYLRSTTDLSTPGAAANWIESQTFPIEHPRSFPRDLRGRIFAAPDHLFDAYLPGVLCSGAISGGQLTVSCSDSDDPWPIATTQKAFYNGMRDAFTGVLAPGFGMELAPFYTAADLPRPTGSAILLNTVSGNVVIVENNIAKPVTGANDWGSDFAVVRSGCGSGAQVLVSGSGAAASGDTLRAFEISGREAIPVSAPVSIDGAITAISPAPDATIAATATNSAAATMIVHHDAPTRYEVWNVTALCN
jgi:hypothetical protein